MKRILFVDDERHVLSGLRRQLHGLRGEWEMTFAPGGPDAGALIEGQQFDLVVTDMQMPILDGAQLLEHVADVQERCARLVLSGHADPDRLLLAATCAHRYLDKPCPPDLLQLEIRQALSVRETLDELQDPGLEQLWCRKPSGDAALDRVTSALSCEPSVKLEQVQRVLTQDEDIWELVSSMLSLDGAVDGPEHAAQAHGSSTLLSVVRVARVAKTLAPSLTENSSRSWEFASQVLRLAREQNHPEDVVTDAFVAGLLDVALTRDKDELWLDVLAYLLPTCGFPDSVVKAVTSGDREKQPSGAAQSVAGILAAARSATNPVSRGAGSL